MVMDKDLIESATRRTVNSLEIIIRAMVAEFEATERLIDTLSERILKLEARELQIGWSKASLETIERLDAIEAQIENFVTASDLEEAIDTAVSDKVSDLDLNDKIGEYVNDLTFTVSVD